MTFSATTRAQNIARLKTEPLDLLIIGGGITGAGVAIQTSKMGIKTGLIEMQDFAGGTSSRSTKLVHGGIRYLKTFDVEVVSDTVKERAVVQQIAPHIPRPAPMLLPIYDEPGATFTRFSVKVAMDLYDKLANVTDPRYVNYLLSKEEVRKREPLLNPENLVGGGVYLDFVNNDARLVIENIKRAHENGGIMASRIQALQLLHGENGRLNGVHVKDRLSSAEFDIHAKLILNTSGPWSDLVRQLDPKNTAKPQMRPTKGVHLVVPSDRLPVPQPTYFDTGMHDGRMTFVVPRGDKTYFGTTDTDYQGDFSHPTVEQADVDYLLKIINHHYPQAQLTLNDIEASWAGLRPLIAANGSSDYNGGQPSKLSDQSFKSLIDVVQRYENQQASRNDVEQVVNHLEKALNETSTNPSAVSRGSDLSVTSDGLLTLAGGKITDYRKMAAGAVALIRDLLAKQFNLQFAPINSKQLKVSGGDLDPAQVPEEIAALAQIGVAKGLPQKEAEKLANLYGTNAKIIFNQNLVPLPGLSLAETLSLHYALTEEMVLSPVDYFLRRTNHLLFQRESLDALKAPVLTAMAAALNWDETEKQRQVQQLDQVIAESDLTALKHN